MIAPTPAPTARPPAPPTLDFLPPEVALPHDPLTLRLDFRQESVSVTEFGEAGIPGLTRLVHPRDIVAALAQETDVSTGLLPCQDTLFYLRHGQAVYCATWVAPRVWPVAINAVAAVRRYAVPLPGLIFVTGLTLRFFAVFAATERPQPGEAGLALPLFAAPTFNVHPNGTICAGTQHFSGRPERTPDEFFGSYFAAEITGRGRSRRHPATLEGLWRELDGRATFPLDDLVPLDNFTVQGLLTWLRDARGA